MHAHPRNIPDAMIRACAATGGVVGINGICTFVGANDNRSETFARHVDHVAHLVGAAHVAIGLDSMFDTQELDDELAKMGHAFPAERGHKRGVRMVAPEPLAEVVRILQASGDRDEDPIAMLGGNLIRLARGVWQPAR